MHDGATQRATITMQNSSVVEIDMPTPGRVVVEWHGGRGKLVFHAPAGAVISRVAGDERNVDDLEG